MTLLLRFLNYLISSSKGSNLIMLEGFLRVDCSEKVDFSDFKGVSGMLSGF